MLLKTTECWHYTFWDTSGLKNGRVAEKNTIEKTPACWNMAAHYDTKEPPSGMYPKIVQHLKLPRKMLRYVMYIIWMVLLVESWQICLFATHIHKVSPPVGYYILCLYFELWGQIWGLGSLSSKKARNHSFRIQRWNIFEFFVKGLPDSLTAEFGQLY